MQYEFLFIMKLVKE